MKKAASSVAPAPTTSVSHSGGSPGAATGDAVATRHGNAQVRVTVMNGKIVKDEAVQRARRPAVGGDLLLGGADPPAEVLSKQTAAVDTVSGAT